MKTVILIGCGKEKLPHSAPAKDLYTGPLFRKARAYAERFGDEWGILSAKHGLVMPNQIIEPYDLALQDLDKDYLKRWIWNTNWFLRSRWPGRRWKSEQGYEQLSGERFVCLAGELYGRCFLTPVKLSVEFPLKGLGVGRRMKYLADALKSEKRTA